MYFVYVVASYSRCLYTGVSSNLVARVGQHRAPTDAHAFTARYRVRRLVYYEVADNPLAAIAREKQIKSWTRAKRVALVERANPGWRDLAARWPEIEPLERRWQ
jgi:putative endonuclease